MNAVTQAIEHVGLAELARRCGVSYQAVRKWERGRVPAERCLDIEKATDGRVTRHDLRPELFGPPPSKAA
jgi:DNA-binding transcriptional regulator YdaS (Cro superfamily)